MVAIHTVKKQNVKCPWGAIVPMAPPFKRRFWYRHGKKCVTLKYRRAQWADEVSRCLLLLHVVHAESTCGFRIVEWISQQLVGDAFNIFVVGYLLPLRSNRLKSITPLLCSFHETGRRRWFSDAQKTRVCTAPS